MDLSYKKILITGANRGIGLALANRLAQIPCHLLLASRSDEAIVPPAHLRALSWQTLQLDLKSYEGIENFFKKYQKELSDVDVLVNNAGVFTSGLFEEQSILDFYETLQINLTATLHMTRRILPTLIQKKAGLIVNNASITGVIQFASSNSYAASKSGVIGFTNALRRELHGTGVQTLLLITPGVKTRLEMQSREVYRHFYDVSKFESVSAEKWAGRCVRAIEKNKKTLYPSGATRILVWLAQHHSGLLDRVSEFIFRRMEN